LKKTVNIANNISKKVVQIKVGTDEVLAEFSSVGIAAKSVNGSQSNLSACINGRKKSAYGFKWRFK
jgi:hypothetical protein